MITKTTEMAVSMASGRSPFHGGAMNYRERFREQASLLSDLGLGWRWPDAFEWAPRQGHRWALDAPMLTRIREASQPWNFSMGMRRFFRDHTRRLRAFLTQRTEELTWFGDVEPEPAGVENRFTLAP